MDHLVRASRELEAPYLREYAKNFAKEASDTQKEKRDDWLRKDRETFEKRLNVKTRLARMISTSPFIYVVVSTGCKFSDVG